MTTQNINISGYNYDEEKTTKKELTPLDKIAKYCAKEGIDYAEYQRREFFGLLPAKVVAEHRSKSKIYLGLE